MNFYKNAALALDHLDKHQGSVKGSLNAAGINCTPGESKRLLACKLNQAHSRRKELMR
jgi:putative methyltransferase